MKRILGLVTGATLILSTDVAAAQENLILVDVDSDPGFNLQGLEGKVAPELQPVLGTAAAIAGITPDGDVALTFPEKFQLSSIPEAFAIRGLSASPMAETTTVLPANELIVFAADVQALSALKESGAIVEVYPPGGFAVIGFDGPITADRIDLLRNNDNVLYIELDAPHTLQALPPDDTDLAQLWGMKNAKVVDAWQNDITKSDVIVAVIDSGIDYKHPDLNVWVNSREIPNNGVDDDGNGYPDDIRGWDFVGNDNDPLDEQSHGTHVAGTIGAIGNNTLGVVGVSWGAPVMAVEIFDKAGNPTSASNIVKAIDYAVASGARVLNNSWSGPTYEVSIAQAISRAESKGVLFVAAASNNKGSDNDKVARYPASYANDNIISVMSIDSNEQRSFFSNIGATSVDIAAPGGLIFSTVPDGKFAAKSGTSMAAPHVSGAAALIWGMPAFKNRSYLEIKSFLLNGARKLPSLNGLSTTGGTLDLSFLIPPPAQPPSGQLDSLDAGMSGQSIEGTLRAPAFALGGETKGVSVETPTGVVDIDLGSVPSVSSPAFQKFLGALDGQQVKARGALRTESLPESGFKGVLTPAALP